MFQNEITRWIFYNYNTKYLRYIINIDGVFFEIRPCHVAQVPYGRRQHRIIQSVMSAVALSKYHYMSNYIALGVLRSVLIRRNNIGKKYQDNLLVVKSITM
mmetsp:Transcript_24513/g.51516  ORF Transcript_24513/g.51516 Transcript_24513/m.51516 type:complete len:101 (-) Transcript_24513:74-376(-)